jgi:hypothetical protein
MLYVVIVEMLNVRVIIERIATALNVHGGQVGIVESLGRGASPDSHVTLVEFELNQARHITLTVVEGVTDEVHLGREPETGP